MAKKICRIVSSILVAVVVAFAAVLLLASVFGFKEYIVLSGSMEPRIHTGSICFVNTHSDYDDVNVGDIIAFKTGKGLMVTHRAIAVTEEGIETKGDANDISDGITTTRENFVGLNALSIPYLGYLFNYLQVTRIRIFVLTGIACLFILSFLPGRGKKTDPDGGNPPLEDKN